MAVNESAMRPTRVTTFSTRRTTPSPVTCSVLKFNKQNKHSATALRAEPVEALLLPTEAAEGRGDKALPAAHDRSVQAGAESFTRRIEFIST